MSKRKTGWKEYNYARDKRKQPLEESELRGIGELPWWETMTESEYEERVILSLTNTEFPRDR